ncbi:MAG: hypothetical protein H0Z24_10115 [Thermosipho sp. (in: Bacteria)]|nr:hypothetical protein [Thermosipho sp. (in: thermotogales)]
MSNNKMPHKRKRCTAQAKMEIVLEGLKGQEKLPKFVGVLKSVSQCIMSGKKFF